MKTLHLSIIAVTGIAVIGIILFAVVLPQLANIKPSESVQQTGTYEYVIHEPYDGIEKNFGTVTIMNQTYYVANLNNGIINSTQPTWLEYYNVTFTFPYGIEPLNTPGGQIIESYVKFPDDPVPYKIAAGISPPPGSSNYTGFTTVLSTHTNPQAGFTFHNGTIQLLINWPKIHSELIINGLNETYQAGKSIDFQIEARGFDNFDAGERPQIFIKNSNGTTIWNNPQYVVLCCVQEFTDYDSKFNFTELGGPIILNQTGLYKLIVSYHFKTIEKQFYVMQRPNGTTLPASFMPCDTPYPQSDTGVAVLYMPVNSIGKICVRYSNPDDTPYPIGITFFDANNMHQNATGITTWNSSGNNTISKGNSTIVYVINTGNQTGFYGLAFYCGDWNPLAVGYDSNSNMTAKDFPFLSEIPPCPFEPYHLHIDSLSGIGVKHISYP
jgi:hypothetical protein